MLEKTMPYGMYKGVRLTKLPMYRKATILLNNELSSNERIVIQSSLSIEELEDIIRKDKKRYRRFKKTRV